MWKEGSCEDLIAGVSLMERRNSMAEFTLPSHASSTLLITSGSTLVNCNNKLAFQFSSWGRK
jgi:hypothetical protein